MNWKKVWTHLDCSLNRHFDINFGLSFKNHMFKEKYEKLSKRLEKLQKEDELEYNTKKEKDFEKILKNFDDKYNKFSESLEQEKNSILEEYRNERMLQLNEIRKNHFNQLLC